MPHLKHADPISVLNWDSATAKNDPMNSLPPTD